MKYGINSYEERLNGAALLDFEYLRSHPESIAHVVERYNADVSFRQEIALSIRNNPSFAASFYRYFGELQAIKSTTKGR